MALRKITMSDIVASLYVVTHMNVVLALSARQGNECCSNSAAKCFGPAMEEYPF